MTCCTVLREEFRLKKFGFRDVKPERFYMWHWRVPPLAYLLYRLLLPVYVLFWFIFFRVRGDAGPFWGIFLTNWSYILLGIYLIWHAVVVCLHYFCSRREGARFLQLPVAERHKGMFHELHVDTDCVQVETEKEFTYGTVSRKFEMETCDTQLPWYLVVTWILLNAISTAAVMVTLVFFVFLFPHDGKTPLSNENAQFHLVNSLIILVEHLTTAVPVRILHVTWPLLYGTVYVLFSLFYWVPDHSRVIYQNVLDWNNAGHTIGMVVLIGVVIIPGIHILFFLLYRLKLVIFRSVHS